MKISQFKDVSLLPVQSTSALMTSLKNIKIVNNKMTNVHMDSNTDSLTINNFSHNSHVNMVKVQKNKSENTIMLDIISANCYNAFALKKNQQMLTQLDKVDEFRENLFKFSIQQQFDNLLNKSSNDSVTNSIDEINSIHGIRCVSMFWIILVHCTTFLSYVSCKEMCCAKL